MAVKKNRRKKPGRPHPETVADELAASLGRGDDFIVTFETGDDGQRLMHVMAGNLITPCMLGTLANRCGLPGQQKCRHMILKTDEPTPQPLESTRGRGKIAENRPPERRYRRQTNGPV